MSKVDENKNVNENVNESVNVEEDKELKNLISLLSEKYKNVEEMKRKLKITKYSISLTGNNNNIDIKKLRKAIARELTGINSFFKK